MSKEQTAIELTWCSSRRHLCSMPACKWCNKLLPWRMLHFRSDSNTACVLFMPWWYHQLFNDSWLSFDTIICSRDACTWQLRGPNEACCRVYKADENSNEGAEKIYNNDANLWQNWAKLCPIWRMMYLYRLLYVEPMHPHCTGAITYPVTAAALVQ